ncbi:hypothetical protein PQX77_003575, partial [Marasmius sp. AFHP31]
SPAVSNIVIIDGLDECGDEDAQLRILSIIQSAYQQAPDFPLRFLICSRPESWIQEAFADEPLFRLSKTVVLDDSLAAREDIRRYFVHHFQEIAASRKYRQVRFPNPWPSKEDLETLVERSCSQFIYAATVIRFIQLAFKHPTEQLRIILDKALAHSSGRSPYPQLDALYDVIVSANPELEELLPILAAILVLPTLAKSPACIELVLGLSTGQVALALRAMHSVLDIGDWGAYIKLYHASFRDYLTEQTRSRHFHIDMPTWTNDITRRWLQNLTTSKIRSYSVDQLHGKVETKPFFTEWIGFCNGSIPKPSRELLEDLSNVDLAFSYFRKEDEGWEGMFEPLDSWVKEYHEHGIDGNEDDDVGLMDRLTRNFQDLPRSFHLEWPPGVSPSESAVLRLLERLLDLTTPDRLDRSEPSTDQLPCVTNCDCDLSAGNRSCNPRHRSYQGACLQATEALVSFLKKHVHDGMEDDREDKYDIATWNIFTTLTYSPLLSHCCPDNTELLSLCKSCFELAEKCPSFGLSRKQRGWAQESLFEWLETLPDGTAGEREALKAQFLALPWERWERVQGQHYGDF